MQTLKFVREEPGFCRVMYRGSQDRVLYALTRENWPTPNALNFYQCTNDGEPSWTVKMPARERFDKYVEPR